MKNSLMTIGNSLKNRVAKVEIKLEKKSPEILLGVGIVCFVGTVVLASRATLKADKVLAYHNQKMKDIHDSKDIVDADPENELEYDETLYRQDVAVQYLKTAGNMAKLYAPSVALGAVSLACILASRNIMQKRYAGAVAACNAIASTFEEYRKRVREEEGIEKDRHYRYGTELITSEEKIKGEDGKIEKVKRVSENVDPNSLMPNDTSRFFDQNNPNWDRNPQFSMMFLRAQQNILNDLLHTRGHVFLNEVYNALGFDHTPEGSIIGWIDGLGDSFIDFGLYDPNKDTVRRFVNGLDNVILLEFNHDGPIWDKI